VLVDHPRADHPRKGRVLVDHPRAGRVLVDHPRAGRLLVDSLVTYPKLKSFLSMYIP
jgi:hypothetical protein